MAGAGPASQRLGLKTRGEIAHAHETSATEYDFKMYNFYLKVTIYMRGQNTRIVFLANTRTEDESPRGEAEKRK